MEGSSPLLPCPSSNCTENAFIPDEVYKAAYWEVW
jgi:hypothetical protein